MDISLSDCMPNKIHFNGLQRLGKLWYNSSATSLLSFYFTNQKPHDQYYFISLLGTKSKTYCILASLEYYNK